MTLTIDIVSDLVCPWCFIGASRLDEAVALARQRHPDLRIARNWLPFFLNPATPPEGEPYRDFMAAKFGGHARARSAEQGVVDAARIAGVEFAFERIALRPNTLLAHRLIHRAQSGAGGSGDVGALVARVFAAYFQRGQDIGDIDVLAGIAAASGDRRQAAIDYLASDAGRFEVEAANKKVIAWGISAVPFFVFADRLGVGGAQSAAVLLGAIEQSLRAPD